MNNRFILGVLVLLLGLVLASGSFIEGSTVIFAVVGIFIALVGAWMIETGLKQYSRFH